MKEEDRKPTYTELMIAYKAMQKAFKKAIAEAIKPTYTELMIAYKTMQKAFKKAIAEAIAREE